MGLELKDLIGWAVSLLGTATAIVSLLVAFLWRRVEENRKAITAMVLQFALEKGTPENTVRKIIKEENNGMRRDLKTMADSMLHSVDNVDRRINELMRDLLNK